MLIYFVSCKILLEAAQQLKPMHFIVYTYLLYLYTTRVVWQTKCELMTCITCMSCVFTGNHVHIEIACNSAYPCQFFKFTHDKRADTRMYWQACIKFNWAVLHIYTYIHTYRISSFNTPGVLLFSCLKSKCFVPK